MASARAGALTWPLRIAKPSPEEHENVAPGGSLAPAYIVVFVAFFCLASRCWSYDRLTCRLTKGFVRQPEGGLNAFESPVGACMRWMAAVHRSRNPRKTLEEGKGKLCRNRSLRISLCPTAIYKGSVWSGLRTLIRPRSRCSGRVKAAHVKDHSLLVVRAMKRAK